MRGKPFWTFDPRPGSVHCAAVVQDPDEFRFITDRGFVVIDGQVADVVGRGDPNLHDPVSGFMRFMFREPFKEAA